jgi:hypothetical protein
VCVAEIAGTTDAVMAGHDGFWLVEFTVREARAAGFEIEVDEDEPPYPGHANLVWGGSKSARKRAQRDLANACAGRWKIRGDRASLAVAGSGAEK